MLNIEIPREGRDPFICELQVALSGIAILKKSEQVVYTIMRMKRPADLVGTYVFDREDHAEPLSPTSPNLQDALGFEVYQVELADSSPPKIDPVDLPRAGADVEDVRTEPQDAGVGDQMMLETIRAGAPAEVGVLQRLFSCGPLEVPVSCASMPCAVPIAPRSVETVPTSVACELDGCHEAPCTG